MKNYIRPIAEVSKFDVADIITASGVVQGKDALEVGTPASVIYNAYVNTVGEPAANETVAVFQW